MLNASVLDRYPKIDMVAVQALLEEKCWEDRRKVIVLDDDPTGVQTVHDTSIYIDWSYDSTERGFEEKGRLFYMLTDSRGLTVERTIRAHLKIGETAAKMSEETGIDHVIVNRGGSILRRYYLLETGLLTRAEEKHRNRAVDREIICPYFKGSGRFTIGNVLYVKYGDGLIPAGGTEFTQNKTFGYHCSNSEDHVEEKIRDRYPIREVLDASLEELHSLDYSVIAGKPLMLHGLREIVANAMDAYDLKVPCIILCDTMKQGRRLVFCTVTGLMKGSGTVSDRPLSSKEKMVTGDRKAGGTIAVGFHTRKTTSWLEESKAVSGIRSLEFNSDLTLDEEKFQEEVQSAVRREEGLLEQGVTVVVYTGRKLLSLGNDNPEAALMQSVKVSGVVQSLMGGLEVTPGFMAAKEEIISNDVEAKALKIKRATALGQARPGVPMWRMGAEGHFPGISCIILPGNMGEAETLKETVEILMGSKR